MATKGGKGKKKSDKKVANEVSVGTDDPEPRNVRDNKPVNLSTLAKDSLASQDKRTNENKSTDNTEKETNKNSPFTIISLSHKKGTLKEERKKERKNVQHQYHHHNYHHKFSELSYQREQQ